MEWLAAVCIALAFPAAMALLLYSRGARLLREELDITRRQLAHAARFALTGEVAARVAREIEAPLAAISDAADRADLLLRGVPPRGTAPLDPIGDIRDNVALGRETAQRLRALVSQGDRPALLDLHDCIRTAERLLADEARSRRMDLILQPCALRPLVTGDAVQLQQLVISLSMNAMDAMADTPLPLRRVLIATHNTGDALQLAVSDRGHGFSPQGEAALLSPFYTTKRKGIGLGLSIARSIVAAHEGELTARRRPGGGAVFTVTLPCVSPPATRGTRTPAEASAGSGARTRMAAI